MAALTATTNDARTEGIMGRIANLMETSMAIGQPEIDAQVRALASTGKMLRPRLAVELALALDLNTDLAKLVPAAAAIELLHCASLFHDDVIDDASFRRGLPTLNATDGTGAAVLIGDLLLARGMLQFRRSGLDGFAWEHALEQLTLGQLFEKRLTAESSAGDIEMYLSLKTAALFESASEMGARCATTDPLLIAEAKTLGRSFGMAFQMLDDLLDVVGDPGMLGKPVEQDMRNGIFGIAPLHAIRQVPSAFAGVLKSKDFDEAYALVRNRDSIAHAIGLIDHHIHAADTAAARLLADRKGLLAGFACQYIYDAIDRFAMAEYAYLIDKK